MSPAMRRANQKVLERAGLVVQGQRAQFRPCTLDPAPLQAVASWADQYRPVWEARIGQLVDRLAPEKDRTP